MKFILICTVLTNILLATTVTCKNKNTANSIYLLSQLQDSILTNIGELYDGLVYGEIDPANSPITYYDNSSAICGGSGNYNRLVEAYCDYNIDSCFEISLGVSGFKALINKEGEFTNNVILVDGIPCLPYNVSNVTVGFYDYDYKDIGFTNFLLTHIESETVDTLTESEAKTQREYCPNLLKYIDEWETLLESQKESINNSIVSIDSLNLNNINASITNLNNTLNNSNNSDNSNSNEPDFSGVADNLDLSPSIDSELESFKLDIENSIENSFNSYSNIFGFTGYGSAPRPITFTVLGATYSAFDITRYEEHLPLIRGAFISFAYLWGFILTVRTLS